MIESKGSKIGKIQKKAKREKRKGQGQKIKTAIKGELRAWMILVEHQKPGDPRVDEAEEKWAKGGLWRWDLALAAGHAHHADLPHRILPSAHLLIFHISTFQPHSISRFGA